METLWMGASTFNCLLQCSPIVCLCTDTCRKMYLSVANFSLISSTYHIYKDE